jgi:hypothetical protein
MKRASSQTILLSIHMECRFEPKTIKKRKHCMCKNKNEKTNSSLEAS